jgi:hypothetical protein
VGPSAILDAVVSTWLNTGTNLPLPLNAGLTTPGSRFRIQHVAWMHAYICIIVIAGFPILLWASYRTDKTLGGLRFQGIE